MAQEAARGGREGQKGVLERGGGRRVGGRCRRSECVWGRPMPSVGAEGGWLGGMLGAVVCASSFVGAVRCARALRHGAAACYGMLPCSGSFAYSVRLGSIGHCLGRGHGFSVRCYGVLNCN